jgi:hypothetical protein
MQWKKKIEMEIGTFTLIEDLARSNFSVSKRKRVFGLFSFQILIDKHSLPPSSLIPPVREPPFMRRSRSDWTKLLISKTTLDKINNKFSEINVGKIFLMYFDETSKI